MIWWTGLAPWEFEFPFGDSEDDEDEEGRAYAGFVLPSSSSSLLLSSLELSDTNFYEP